MSRRGAIAFAVVALSSVALAGTAWADKRTEAIAADALKKAESDYLATDYAAGAARLEKALRRCGTKRCAPETLALLWRDIGTMQFESGNATAATTSWTEALKLQPNLELNAGYDRPDLRTAWEEAKGGGASPSPSATPSDGGAESDTASTVHGSEELERPPAPEPKSEAHAEALPEEESGPPRDEPREPPAVFARLWVGVAGATDFVSVPAGDDVCKLSASGQPANTAGFYCTNPDGSDFPSRAPSTQNGQLATRGQAGHIDGGVKVGNQRIMLLMEYALTANVLVGGRFGYVLGSYTGDAAVKDGRAFGPKLHFELRGTYVLGHAPLTREGFAPVAFVAAGMSEFDSASTSAATLNGVAGQHPVSVWLTNAPFFVGLGGGMRYQFSPRVAFTAAVRLDGVFGGNGFLSTYGPEVAAQYGF